jgi:hypothetical protein
MSIWSYVHGAIEVEPRGRTQAEKEYILKTVLSHLPRVNGSEEPMRVYINETKGYNVSCNHDEFLNSSNLGTGYPRKFETQSVYLVTILGYLRDVEYDEAIRMFTAWMCRFSKRILIEDCIVKIECEDKQKIFTNNNRVYTDMFEYEDSWTDYLMWDYNQDEDGYIIPGKPESHKEK